MLSKVCSVFLVVVYCVAGPVVHGQCMANGTATYRVTYTAAWVSPSRVNSSHYSPLTGASHSSAYSLFAEGATATDGLELLAETGNGSALLNEIRSSAGNFLAAFQTPPIRTADGTSTGKFNVTKDFPLASVVAMLAPSPDWFVGVHDVNLCNGTAWHHTLTLRIYPYDAGTDSGTLWTSGDNNTDPSERIARLTSTSDRAKVFADYNNGSWGSIAFMRTDTVSSQTSVQAHQLVSICFLALLALISSSLI